MFRHSSWSELAGMGYRHFPASECAMIIKLPQVFALRTHWVTAVWSLPKGGRRAGSSRAA
jgi:hypothetical protein